MQPDQSRPEGLHTPAPGSARDALFSAIAALAPHAGSDLSAIRLLREELDHREQKAVAAARSKGATWQQVADELGLGSRQAALKRFRAVGQSALPGMSAAAMARRLGINQQTVANNTEGHGLRVITYPARDGARPLKRYFLPNDSESAQ